MRMKGSCCAKPAAAPHAPEAPKKAPEPPLKVADAPPPAPLPPQPHNGGVLAHPPQPIWPPPMELVVPRPHMQEIVPAPHGAMQFDARRHPGQPFHLRAPPAHGRVHWDGAVDHLSRIPRLDNIEMAVARGYRLNFRDYPAPDCCHDYSNYNYRPHDYCPPLPAPPPVQCHPHHYPELRHYNYALPALDHHEHHYGPPPPPHGYCQYNYFSDENPNGCTIM
ncbi:unnamed protein product [Cuscuta epithymum]|uniref:Uncharacterized protein n=1 Tax=Cuscuta epithymum TaxID=186058 RepID=A0AAV0CD29_9ASTE|nr:unnamed protein product [Cuscuta epithymum]